jgi:hypothetical protein
LPPWDWSATKAPPARLQKGAVGYKKAASHQAAHRLPGCLPFTAYRLLPSIWGCTAQLGMRCSGPKPLSARYANALFGDHRQMLCASCSQQLCRRLPLSRMTLPEVQPMKASGSELRVIAARTRNIDARLVPPVGRQLRSRAAMLWFAQRRCRRAGRPRLRLLKRLLQRGRIWVPRTSRRLGRSSRSSGLSSRCCSNCASLSAE